MTIITILGASLIFSGFVLIILSERELESDRKKMSTEEVIKKYYHYGD